MKYSMSVCSAVHWDIPWMCGGTRPAEVWFYGKVTLSLHRAGIAANIYLKWSMQNRQKEEEMVPAL